MKLIISLLSLFMCQVFIIQAQSLEDLLDNETDDTKEKEYTESTFKTVRIINSHSTKSPKKKELILLISHRFGNLDEGFTEFFGLDQATIRLGVEYGISDRLCVGYGRSTYKKNYDLSLKYKILRQSSDMPVTMSFLGFANISSIKSPYTDKDLEFNHRMSYVSELLIARKFGNRLSLQIMPSFIHRNLVTDKEHDNDVLAIGVGGRVKLTNRIAFTGEYHYILSEKTADNYDNSLSLGFDIETGGHIFQLFFTNSTEIYDAAFIPETNKKWLDGNIRFGFNIIRTFSLGK